MTTTLRLGALEIHALHRQVWLAGRSVAIGARAFDVLLALAQRNERLVSKNELLDLVWPGQVVEDNNLTVQVSALRKALGGDAITTVPGRGYRLALGGGAPAAAPPVVMACTARLQRRLVALAQASVVGWNKLIARHAAEAVPAWKQLRTDVIEPGLREFGGRPEELTPERMLVEFASAVDAAQWALHVQRQVAARPAGDGAPRLHLRIGIVVDDAIVDDGKLLGMGLREVDELHAVAQHDEVLVSDALRAFIVDKVAAVMMPVDAGSRPGKVSAQSPWLLRAPAAQAADAASGVATGTLAPARRLPTVAVLPLHNLGADTDTYLATGLTEQVITFLSLYKSLAVIAHGSTLAVDRGGAGAQAAASLLGADYVLTGTLKRQQMQLHIEVTLTHVPTQGKVLEQPFLGDLGDLLGFQEQLAADIAAAIDPEVLASEMRLLMRRPTDNPGAYDCLLRGMALVHDFRHGDAGEAAAHLRRALSLDPGYAQAHAQLAWWHNLRIGEGRSREVEADRLAALDHAQRAVELDPQDATVLAIAGHLKSFLGKQYTHAMALFNQALAINPSCAQAWARSATTLAYMGFGEQAMTRVQQALRLSPRDPNRFAFLTTRGTAAIVLTRYDEAAAWLAQARRLNPEYRAALRLFVAALMLGGDAEQARALGEEFMNQEPDFRVAEFGRWYPLQEPHLSRVLEALRAAGMPG